MPPPPMGKAVDGHAMPTAKRPTVEVENGQEIITTPTVPLNAPASQPKNIVVVYCGSSSQIDFNDKAYMIYATFGTRLDPTLLENYQPLFDEICEARCVAFFPSLRTFGTSFNDVPLRDVRGRDRYGGKIHPYTLSVARDSSLVSTGPPCGPKEVSTDRSGVRKSTKDMIGNAACLPVRDEVRRDNLLLVKLHQLMNSLKNVDVPSLMITEHLGDNQCSPSNLDEYQDKLKEGGWRVELIDEVLLTAKGQSTWDILHSLPDKLVTDPRFVCFPGVSPTTNIRPVCDIMLRGHDDISLRCNRKTVEWIALKSYLCIGFARRDSSRPSS